LEPQHWTCPSLNRAHVWYFPTLIRVAVKMPNTVTGMALSLSVALPSWP
jgi:hypothetical protein